jgi:hypothetical protein
VVYCYCTHLRICIEKGRTAVFEVFGFDSNSTPNSRVLAERHSQSNLNLTPCFFVEVTRGLCCPPGCSFHANNGNRINTLLAAAAKR